MIYASPESNLNIGNNYKLVYQKTICNKENYFVIHTLGGLNGYSGVKWMSKKKTPPSYTEPGGPKIVLTHSYTLSPLGPALKIF